jgi:hypothetical protein
MERLSSTGVAFVIRPLKAAADLRGRPDGVIFLTESFLDFDHTALAFRMHPSSGPASTSLVSRSAAISAYFFPSNAGRS